MSQKQCVHEKCVRSTFGYGAGKCIFHCEKNDKSDWFIYHTDSGRDLREIGRRVKIFWDEFRIEWVNKRNSDFSFFIFPEFTNDADFLRDPTLRQLNKEESKQSLSFFGSHFLGPADLFLITFTQDVDFHSTTFMQKADFNGAKFTQDADFGETSFMQGASYNRVTFLQSAKFQDVKFSGNSTFEGTGFQEQTRFEKCVFDGSTSFLDLLDAPNLSFHSAVVNGRFRIGANLIAKMKLIEIFQCTFKKDSVVIIHDLIIDDLSINHLVCLSPAIKLGNLEVTKELTINNSMLSGAELNNINLEKASLIKIAYSSLSKTIFNTVRWGKVERIKADRDTFRQLKAANEDQKNYLQANEFYMMEMKAYREELKDKEWWRQERIDWDCLTNCVNAIVTVTVLQTASQADCRLHPNPGSA